MGACAESPRLVVRLRSGKLSDITVSIKHDLSGCRGKEEQKITVCACTADMCWCNLDQCDLFIQHA